MSNEAMVPCDHVIAKLWEYLDGGLDRLRSDEVQRHLDICGRCFPEYDFRRAYLQFMRRCAFDTTPPELRRRIFALVLDEQVNERLMRQSSSWWDRVVRRFFMRR